MMKRFPTPDLKWLFFSRRGRIARKSYALAAIFLMLVIALILVQIVKAAENQSILAAWGFIMLIVGLLCTYCFVALSLKRLNDLSLPWYFVVALFIPTINYIFIGFMMFLPSKQETNEHGPPPFPNVN